MSLDSDIANAIAKQMANYCVYCSGTGKQKQFEMLAQVNGPTISRTSNKTIKCKVCNGIGRTKYECK